MPILRTHHLLARDRGSNRMANVPVAESRRAQDAWAARIGRQVAGNTIAVGPTKWLSRIRKAVGL